MRGADAEEANLDTDGIQPDGRGKDVFVHISAAEKAGLSVLSKGDQLTFDIVPNRGKEWAEHPRLM